VSIDRVPFSVTTSSSPDGENETCAGLAPSRCCDASGAPSVVKPLTVAEPAFKTYNTFPCTVTEIGRTPPDGNTVCSCSPFGCTANTDTELLPALTA
jgi:hypothetical protein